MKNFYKKKKPNGIDIINSNYEASIINNNNIIKNKYFLSPTSNFRYMNLKTYDNKNINYNYYNNNIKTSSNNSNNNSSYYNDNYTYNNNFSIDNFLAQKVINFIDEMKNLQNSICKKDPNIKNLKYCFKI